MSEGGAAPGTVEVRLGASLRSMAGGRQSFPIAAPTVAADIVEDEEEEEVEAVEDAGEES